MTKQCTECAAVKPLTDYFKDKGFKDGYYSRCKVCKTKSTMEWRASNKDKYNAYMRASHKKTYARDRLYRYNLTPEAYEALKVAQNGLCAVCIKPPAANKPLVIDHDHTSGAVRGLLCYKCNRDMVVVDDPGHLDRCLAYKKAS